MDLPEIMIVEDSRTQAMRLQRLLEQEGFAVTVAHDGEEALAALRKKLPAMVVSDIVMPGVDGYELCRRIRADPALKHLPVILLTGLTDPQDIVNGLRCGADNFLLKPCDDTTLMERIRYLMSRRDERPADSALSGLEVVLSGRSRLLGASQTQILDLLLASCEVAAEKTAELRRAIEQAERARAEAERANRAKTEFLARISHEVRTPLNAILGFAELLNDSPLDEEGVESLEQIVRGGEHLLHIASEMMDISRIESGSLAVSLEPVQWREVVERSVDMIRPLAGKRAVRIQCDFYETEVAWISANPQRLGEVMINLVSNAVKYNRVGGAVTLTNEKAPGEMLRIKVTDTGLGIAPDKLPLLFNPFERLGAEKSQVEGSGLGLALSQRLAAVMGGRIGVESVVGAGSTFWLEMPIGESQK
ncbi:MAG TPA: response regulator [Chthoniobacteraceae bacterium]